MPAGGGPRLLLRRLREIMAEQTSAQMRLDKLVTVIASNMVAEVCSIYLRRAGKILELLDRGTFNAWERIIAETPDSVLDLLEIPGIGPKTAATLHQKFKVSSLPELKKFVAGGGLELVDGIGPKTADRIKESLR